jgi:CheY-like chemotaxis protein
MSEKPILVVDDEALVLESVRMTLVHYGYSVDTATSGIEALAKLQCTDFGLVVTDCKMPNMTGDQLAAEVKRQWPRLPVLLLTGYPPERIPEGVDGIVLKPFSVRSLRGIIYSLLKGGNAPAT